MTPTVESIVAATYVRDIDASRAFYARLGLTERRSGTAPTAAWSELTSDDARSILLVSTQPGLGVPALPLLFYFFVADLEVLAAALAEGGVDCQHLGHPDHAPGGELRVSDPDGNTVLIGQRTAGAGAPVSAQSGAERFSLLREAATAVAAHRGEAVRCQVGAAGFGPCGQDGEVKMADAAGDTVWACIPHAEEILVSVPGAFIADAETSGIADFLARRRS